MKELQKIKSFTIDHTIHEAGFYLATVANNIFTYDLRFKHPNGGDYVDIAAMHTIEHLFATVVRNSELKDQVVYFGPMGCRTGFYLLLLGINKDEALELTKKCMRECLELDEVPGCAPEECGNYKEHNLSAAKKEIEAYLKVLDEQTVVKDYNSLRENK